MNLTPTERHYLMGFILDKLKRENEAMERHKQTMAGG